MIGPADIFLLLGTICIAAGVGLVLGIGAALVSIGVLSLVAGVMIGRSEAKT